MLGAPIRLVPEIPIGAAVPEFVNEKPAWLLVIISLNESYGTSVPMLWQFLRIRA